MNIRCLFIATLLLAASLALAADPQETAGKPQAKLALGQPAPEITATNLDGKSVALASYFNATPPKSILLQFASGSDPIFRAHTPAVERMAQKYSEKVAFIIIYQRESHPADTEDALQLNSDDGFSFPQPSTIADRMKTARQIADRLQIKNQTILVDVWPNTTSLRYGSYPNMTFLIDAKGILQAGYPWMDPPRVQGALDSMLAGKPIPQAFQGSVKLSNSAPLDFTNAALDMTGGRNAAASIANVLDKFNLSDNQKAALYPALAEYLASLQNFRATSSAVPGRANTTRPALPPNATAPKTATLDDAQKANQALHAAADKLKTVIKQNLPTKDAATLFEALEQSQAQRLFVNP